MGRYRAVRGGTGQTPGIFVECGRYPGCVCVTPQSTSLPPMGGPARQKQPCPAQYKPRPLPSAQQQCADACTRALRCACPYLQPGPRGGAPSRPKDCPPPQSPTLLCPCWPHGLRRHGVIKVHPPSHSVWGAPYLPRHSPPFTPPPAGGILRSWCDKGLTSSDDVPQVTGGRAGRIDWESLEVPFWLADRLDRLGFKFPTGVGLRGQVYVIGHVPLHTSAV